MKQKNKIMTLKIIKVTFDVVLVALSLFVLSFMFISVFNINNNIVFGTVNISKESKAIVLNDDTPTTINGMALTLQPNYVQAKYELNLPSQHSKAMIYRIFFYLSLNLSLLFMIFVIFQIRNIINSIVKSEKEEKKLFKYRVFSQKNLKRMRYITYGFLAMPIIECITVWIDDLFLKHYVIFKGFNVYSTMTYSDVSWDYILVGLMFFAFIEVIRKGIAIQNENDLTI